MSGRVVRFVGPDRRVVAVAAVADEGDHFAGTIDLSATPPAMLAVFREWEEVVNGQMFSFLDEVEARVAALGLRAELDEGEPVRIRNLQVYPGHGEVSFQLAPVSAPKTPA
jgi:hypothetical protein